jgi:N,N-dimethylformamidase beta subunit-like, C-terminal
VPRNVPPTVLQRPPLFPPNFQTLGYHKDWRRTWTHIVAGKFSTSPYDGLLFYEQSTGYAEFYETNGLGQLKLLRSHEGWRQSWTHIISGAFFGMERTGLLFYDQGAGFAAIYDTDEQGNLIFPPREHSNWRPSWTHIRTLRLPRDRYSDYSAVVLYDQLAGHGEIHACTGDGGLRLIVEEDGWRTSWSHMVGDSFCGTGVLFYEDSTAHGEIYAVTGNADDGFGFDQMAEAENLPAATDIIPGNFGSIWPESSFIFYDRPTGRATFVFYSAPPDGKILSDPNDGTGNWETYDDWRATWDIIVPGNFWEPDAEYVEFQNGFTDLFFYDQSASYSEFCLHEPFNAIPAENLEGYVSPESVLPGETIHFYVNSRVGLYTIKVYRQDRDEVLVATITSIHQFSQPFPIGRLDYRDGPSWPAVAELTIPSTWRSALYLARIEANAGGLTPLVIPFVVRTQNPGSQSTILICIPDATYAAYNFWGGRSLYGFTTNNTIGWSFGPTLDPYPNYQIPRAFRVALARPYLPPGDLAKWQRWEVPLLKWLARHQIEVEMSVGTDLHKDQANHSNLLKNYRLLVSVGHDEYWSKEMRDNVEGFASAGGNVVFFSGNVSWFQIRFDLSGRRQICYKDPRFDPYTPTDSDAGYPDLVTGNWYDRPVCRAETSLTGVSYLYWGDGWPQYFIKHRDHWVFRDVTYDRFGLYTLPGDTMPYTVVGYETDHIQHSDEDCKPNSPDNFYTLAEVPMLNPKDHADRNYGVAATMGIFAKGKGQVLTVGTINWTLGLQGDKGSDSWNDIDQITWNIFDQFK